MEIYAGSNEFRLTFVQMHVNRREFLSSISAALQPPQFGVSARLVVVPVTVTGADGHKIAGLKRADFRLFDAGTPRDFEVEDILTPLSLMVAVQTGVDSGPALDKIRKTRSLFEPLLRGEGGEVGLLSYASEVRLLAPLARNSYAFDREFAGLRPKGTDGRMHDAVGESVRLLAERPAGRRRALLLIGEAKDRDSKTSLLRAAEVAQAANVQVYAVTYSRMATAFTTREQIRGTGPGVDILGGLRELSRLGSANSAAELARMTGGMTQSFAKLSGLERTLTTLSDELHQQYVISFAPGEAMPGEFRPIRVELPGQPGAVLRHRPGYWVPEL